MSNATPPGWYPDVNVPGTERWWDGAAWTGHARTTAVTQPLGPAPGGSGSPARRGGRTVALALTGLAVLAAVGTAFLVMGEDGGGGRPASVTGTSAPPSATGGTGTPTPSPAGGPEEDTAELVDQLNGVAVPIPDGWEKPESTLGDTSTMRTADSYSCPGDSASYCYHGTVTVRTASGTDLTAMEALAGHDIVTAADNAYGEDLTGTAVHGGITAHEELASRPVTVAGRTGHLVRWRVTTGKGPGGYVQSLVFPSAVGSETPVIVRFAFDAGQGDLPLALMDGITRGIHPVGDATGGGVGSTVAP